MKRFTIFFLSLLVVLSMVLTACGPAETEPPATEEPTAEPTAEPTEEPTAEPTEEPTAEPTEEPTPEPTTRKGGWLDEIVYSVVDAASAVTQLQAGAIDMYSSGLSSDVLPEIEEAGFEYAESGGLYYELTFNVVGPIFEESTGKVNPFFDPRAREAMNWLIDRDYINREVYNGGALPKFFNLITNMPEYTRYAATVRALEAEYAYDMDRADAAIEEVMLGIEGVTREDGMYMFDGEQVELIMLIRNDSDGTRVPIGDYVANQLEEIGFATDRQYKTSSEASPIWVLGNPGDGLFHIYTGAWGASVISRNEADNFQFFDTPASLYGFSALWQAFDDAMANPERYQELANDLANNAFNSLEERDAAMEEMLPLAMKESIHVWLIDGRNFVPYADGVSTGFDLMAGVDNSYIYPYTIRFEGQEGGTMNIGQSDIFVDPWNPVAGSNWTYDNTIRRATDEYSYMLDPYTGLIIPRWFERAEVTVQEGLPVGKTLDYITLDFSPEIVVPEDAIVDWDAENQAFITVAEKFPDGVTAKVKSVVYYPEDFWGTVKWHDGSEYTLADGLYSWIIGLDVGKEGSAIYDESQAANVEAGLEVYRGFRILSEDPLIVESYSDYYQTDAELSIVNVMDPNYGYGVAPWHSVAVASLADAAGEAVFSADKADALSTDTTSVEWLNFIGGPSLDIMAAKLDEAIAESYIPYANVLGDYITAEEALARYENLKAFYEQYGHFWASTGPYILNDVFLTEQVATVVHNPDYPYMADRWSSFGAPQLADLEVEGEGSVILGEEIVFDLYVTYEGDPYPDADMSRVFGLLYDATGAIVAEIDAEFVEDGYYTVTVPADISAEMEAGASKLEAVVVPSVVAIPTFVTFEFVTIE